MFQKQPQSVAVILFSAFKSPLVAPADSRAGSMCGDVVRGGQLLRIMLLEGGREVLWVNERVAENDQQMART